MPAPPGLIAEGTLREPDAVWSHVQKGSAGRLAGMPDSAAGAILSWAGADVTLGPLVVGSQPFHVALGDAPDGLAFAVAMKLKDVAAARSTLVDGDVALYRAEEADGMLRLAPRTPDPAAHPALAIAGAGYLVVASTPADLATLGAYAARTLPGKPPPTSALELRADPAALGRAGKNAPDFAAKVTGILAASARELLPREVDAAAFAACFTPGIRDMVAAAGDLAEARLDADPGEGQVDTVAVFVPKPGDSGARRRLTAMHPAAASPLLDAPADATAALFWSDTAQLRAEDASTLGPCLGAALGPILGTGGGPKLAELLAAWARGRGDWETASFLAIPSVAGLVVRAPVADAASASGSIRGFAELASQPSVADAVRRLLPLRAGAVEPVEVPRVGKASVVMFPGQAQVFHGPGAAPTAAPDLAPPGLAWAVDAKEADLGLGLSPQELLAQSRPTASYRSHASVERTVGALGADASFVAILAPPGCCKGTAPAAAPLTFAWGRRAGNGRATLTLGDQLLGQILARLTGP